MKKKRGGRRREEEEEENSRYEPPLNIETRFATVYTACSFGSWSCVGDDAITGSEVSLLLRPTTEIKAA